MDYVVRERAWWIELWKKCWGEVNGRHVMCQVGGDCRKLIVYCECVGPFLILRVRGDPLVLECECVGGGGGECRGFELADPGCFDELREFSLVKWGL